MEHTASFVAEHPVHRHRLLVLTRTTAQLLTLEHLNGKLRVIERQLTLPRAAALPTCATFFAHGIYVGTSGGKVCTFSATGAPLFADTSDVDAAILPGVLELEGEDGAVLPVTQLIANRETLAVASANSNLLLLCRHAAAASDAAAASAAQVVTTLEIAQTSDISCMDFGGPDCRDLVLQSSDGIQVALSPGADTSGTAIQDRELVPRVLVDAHCGCVKAAVATGRPGEIATGASDGSVRLWDASLGVCAAKRTFGAPISTLAAMPAAGLLAAGSASGVVRVLASAAGLPVTAARRLSTSAVTHLTFSPPGVTAEGHPLLAALCGAEVFVLQLGAAGVIAATHRVPLTSQPAAIAFAPSTTAEGEGPRRPCLLVSLTSPELLCIPLPLYMTAEAIASATPWHMKVESPLLHMAPCASAALASLYSVCADKGVRLYEVPNTAAAWTSSKGRIVRSVHKATGEGRAVGAQVAVAPTQNGALLAVSSRSGCVQLRVGLNGATPQTLSLCDAVDGGAEAVAFDAEARHLLVAAADGSVVMATVNAGAPLITAALPTVPDVPVGLDADVLDDATLPLFDDQTDASAGAPGHRQCVDPQSAEHLESVAKFKLLQQRFDKLLECNTQASAREQLPRAEFVIDNTLVSTLKDAGQARVAAITERLKCANAAASVAAQRIRTQCHDSLDEPVCAVGGVCTQTVVTSFATASCTAACQQQEHVRFLRGVETAEAAATGGGRSVRHLRVVDLDESGAPVTAADGEDTAASPAADAPQVATTVDEALFSDWDLSTASRRVANATLLAGAAVEVRRQFNAKFAKVSAAKHAAMDKIKEQNVRLKEIAQELRIMGFAVKADDVAPLRVRPTAA